MGIDGLLNLLKPVTQKEHISSFKDKTVAVDAMPWIYKGCYSCAMQLNQKIESIDFLYYLLEMLDMLSYYNIKPIFVFDGRAVQAKNGTLEKRKKNKEQNKRKGLEFLKNNQMQEARKYLSRCIIIDERILTTTINALITKNIDFIVAPYEADCQIAKLKRLGMVDAAISQDSDLVVFDVNVILKLNQNGECDYIDLDLWRPRDVDDKFLKYFLAFDKLNRIDAAVLAGSDYNDSVKGIGIKRAIKLLATQATMNNVINKLKTKKNYKDHIPENYETIIQKSKLIFCLSTVYNPQKKCLEYLAPQLQQKIKPKQMTTEQLLEIVGNHYAYTEEVISGRVNGKTLQKREIKVLDFPKMFRINKDNMLSAETTNKRRKLQIQELKRQRINEEGALGATDPDEQNQAIIRKLNQNRKRAEQRINQTEENRKQRLEERKNRISKLQELMNKIVEDFSDSDQDQVIEEEVSLKVSKKSSPISSVKENISLGQNSLNPQKIKKSEQKLSQTTKNRNMEEENDQVSEEESVEEELGFLNPFVKKDFGKKTTKNHK